MPRQFDYSKNPKIIYIIEERLNLLGELGLTVGLTFNLRSTALMKRIYANRYTYIVFV